jgi:hypothetical protein
VQLRAYGGGEGSKVGVWTDGMTADGQARATAKAAGKKGRKKKGFLASIPNAIREWAFMFPLFGTATYLVWRFPHMVPGYAAFDRMRDDEPQTPEFSDVRDYHLEEIRDDKGKLIAYRHVANTRS